MASVFEFTDYGLEVTIASKDFCIECDSDVGDRMNEIAKGGRALIEQIDTGKKSKDDAIKYLSNAIDSILGAGATEKIFEDRKIRVTDCSDILIFLSAEIAAKNKAQKERLLNRQQRRAAAKAK